MAKMIKKRLFLKITRTTFVASLHQLPWTAKGDPAPEVHCFKVESCWGVKPNMPKQFSSAAAAMLVALSTNKYLSWRKNPGNLKKTRIAWKLDDAIGRMLMSLDVTWESHFHGFNLDLKSYTCGFRFTWQVYSIRPESSLVVMMDISWTRIDALQWQCHQEAKEWHVDSLSMIRINYWSKSLHLCILQLHLASEDIVLAIYHP